MPGLPHQYCIDQSRQMMSERRWENAEMPADVADVQSVRLGPDQQSIDRKAGFMPLSIQRFPGIRRLYSSNSYRQIRFINNGRTS